MTWEFREPKRVTACTPLDTRGPKRLWEQGPGFVVRRRGATDEPVALEFLCPTCGRFTARVSKVDTPDEVPCPQVRPQSGLVCGLTSPWSPSKLGVWASAGEVTG
jgi:hypothetical protein